jgi:hypothetical protein
MSLTREGAAGDLIGARMLFCNHLFWVLTHAGKKYCKN